MGPRRGRKLLRLPTPLREEALINRKGMAKCVRTYLMQCLFLASFLVSLVHISRHLLTVDKFFSLIADQADGSTGSQNTSVARIVVQGHTSIALENPRGSIPITATRTHTASADISRSARGKRSKLEREKLTTWALVAPPGLLGGYRNQVIRMFGMVIGATQQNVKRFLLPSILWSTMNDKNEMRSVPMEDIFDIEHWNSFDQLPRLVENIEGGDCWHSDLETTMKEDTVRELVSTLRSREDAPLTERIIQKRRFLKPIFNVSLAYATGELVINPRRYDVSAQVSHCTHPVAYGAGGGRGLLWVNYMEYNRKRQRDTGSVQPDPLEKTFLQALRPKKEWRVLAQQCVASATQPFVLSLPNQRAPYIALHARIEGEMMAHPCGAHMNKNMTRILEDMQQFVERNENLRNVSGIFVALSRSGASVTEGPAYRRFRAFVDENIHTLAKVLGDSASPGQGLPLNHGERNLPVFECGEQLVQKYYESKTGQPTVDYGSLLPSIINFDVAVEASVFIGFRFSSWSNSVWTTRYYLGRGDDNYEYTRERGIQRVENGGLPPPHQNCDGIQDPGR